ncbi:MAG: D-glycerate dehydrogenase [DPANN group archaeon]|nr:D-glycerate dehydrogenase [DPANN group archaeon]
MKKLFVTKPLPGKVMERLKDSFDITVNEENRHLSREEIIEGVKGKDGLVSLLTDPIDSTIMDAEPNLKIIANYAVGFNNIDLKAATDRNILVTNTPGVLDETTADLAFTLLCAAARRIHEGEKFLRSGSWDGWGPLQFLGQDIHKRTLGIVGLGRIGKEVARRGNKGFCMPILYADPRKNEEFERMTGAKHVDIRELFMKADFVSLHCPLNDKTHHLVNRELIDLMKPTAILINTARGPVVDEKALVQALREKKIFAAALDVFEHEPKISEELLALDNAIMVPHIGSASIDTRTRMGDLVIQNLEYAFRGERPPFLVNKEAWKSQE